MLAEISPEPFSFLSNPINNITGSAPTSFIRSIDSFAAVPADKTSSIINVLPLGYLQLYYRPRHDL